MALTDQEKWPKQPKLETTKSVLDEQKPMMEAAFNAQEKVPEEWDLLLSRANYWRTLRITAWALRSVNNLKGHFDEKVFILFDLSQT